MQTYKITEKTKPDEYLLVEEGGIYGELYLRTAETLEEAHASRVACLNAGSYRTTTPVAAPVSLLSHPQFFDVVGALLDSLDDMEYPELKRETLVIENVDLSLLENQRIALRRVLTQSWMGASLAADVETLAGLENMLDDWSDQRAREAGPSCAGRVDKKN
tara:strand:- start:140 stop:622 length:483 start_codon:yes stop_codon:yes gene_type:complete